MPATVALPPIHPGDAIRFDGLVDRDGGPDACWPFLGGLVHGYGYFRLGKRKVRAHRVAWAMWSGQPEPDGPLDHLCHDPATCVGPDPCPHRRCCNPAHLAPSTDAANNASSRRRTKAMRDRCPEGHPFDAANTYVKNGSRLCRRCRADWRRANHPRRGRRLDYLTHCPHGHAWTTENTYTNPAGSRVCRQCTRDRPRRRERAA